MIHITIVGYIGIYILIGLVFGYLHGQKCLRMRRKFEQMKDNGSLLKKYTDDTKALSDGYIKRMGICVGILIWPLILFTMLREILIWCRYYLK